MSAIGGKRTCRFALQMSAFDPKRTFQSNQHEPWTSSKSIKTSAQETVVAAGKSAAEGTKTLVGELAHAATAAAATAAATATAAQVC